MSRHSAPVRRAAASHSDAVQDKTHAQPGDVAVADVGVARDVFWTALGDFGLILALIFGGCCSNALTLEVTTKVLPASGVLLTLAQFVATAATAAWGELEWRTVRGYRVLWLRKPTVPLRRWFVQVALYFATSLLNNTAFAYHIPMSVHIVFRSGGMVVNMILGWGVDNKRYSLLQVTSVLLVTVGVAVATLSSAGGASDAGAGNSFEYGIGVLLLSAALVSSGVMGIFQERTFRRYGRDHWHESLFYSHLFSLPLFLLHPRSLMRQIEAANRTPRTWVGFSQQQGGAWGVEVPSYYVGLSLNVLTQLLCINGVNRLTAKVSSLSVSLVLVVRKAASLVISVILLNLQTGNMGLWLGAAAVMIGTLGYTYGGMQRASPPHRKKA